MVTLAKMAAFCFLVSFSFGALSSKVRLRSPYPINTIPGFGSRNLKRTSESSWMSRIFCQRNGKTWFVNTPALKKVKICSNKTCIIKNSPNKNWNLLDLTKRPKKYTPGLSNWVQHLGKGPWDQKLSFRYWAWNRTLSNHPPSTVLYPRSENCFK